MVWLHRFEDVLGAGRKRKELREELAVVLVDLLLSQQQFAEQHAEHDRLNYCCPYNRWSVRLRK